MKNNKICEMLGIKYPIFQGAMAWVSGGELAGAVSRDGGLGIIAGGGMEPELLRENIRKAKAIFEECKKELQEKEIEFDKNIMLGIMVETPAVAFRAKHFAKECDFFSIGTNDLTQYTLAVDRGNEKIANLYDTYNPAVLQAIKMLIDGAHEGGIKISMCGEFAGDENAVAILFGMGLDSFSMSGISIPRVKRILMKLDKKECEKLVERILELSTASEIKNEVKEFMKNIA